jgi:hypothetical protein
LETAFIQEKRDGLRNQLVEGKWPLQTRLRLAVGALNEMRLLLLIDNFEDALDLERRVIADPNMAWLYRHLGEQVVRGSRVLVTCRYLPVETPVDMGTVLHMPVPELEEHNFLKFLRADDRVNERMNRGELVVGTLRTIFGRIGGTPRFLEAVRKILCEASAEDLATELTDDRATNGGLSGERDP